MSIQFQGSDRKLELPQSHPSSSSSTYNYAYAYIISSPSDAGDGPKAEAMAMKMKEVIRSTTADSGSSDDNIPVAQPWPESKSTLPTNKSSPSSAKEEEEEEDDDDIDAQLKVVLESLQDLYRECEILFRKVFFKNQQKNEGQVDPKRKKSLELGKKRVSRILKETKWNQTKAGMLQRSLSVDSPRTPLGRFKVKTLDLGGGSGGALYGIKGSTKDD